MSTEYHVYCGMFLVVVAYTHDVDRTLLEIPADEDPLWLYFDSHYARIMDALASAERKATQEIDCRRFLYQNGSLD